MWLFLLGLLACTDKAEDDSGPCPGPDCGPKDRDDTGHPDDSGVQDGGATDGGTPVATMPEGIELLEIDNESLWSLGVQIRKYGITEAHDPYYTSNEGLQAYFYVMRSRTWDYSAGPVRSIIWLHGGGTDIDDESIPEPCTVARSENLAFDAVVGGRHVIPQTIAEEGGVLLLPVASWCDIWTGLGEDDPVDSNHKSLVHIASMVEALVEGVDQVRLDPERIGIWGSSLGGVGVFPASYHLSTLGYPPKAVVTDSGPVEFSAMYEDGRSIPIDFLDHLLGGPPTEGDKPSEWHDNWSRVDPLLLIEERGLRVPVLSMFNSHDRLTASSHGRALERVMGEHYVEDGVRYYSLDFNHKSPGERYHTQSAVAGFPGAYATDAAIDFLDGATVKYWEIEELCTAAGCPVPASTDTDDANNALVRSVNATAIEHSADLGPGMVARADLPDSLPTDRPVRVSITIDSDGVTGTSEDPLLRISLIDGDSVLMSSELGEHQLSTRSTTSTGRLGRMAASTFELEEGVLAEADRPQLVVELLDEIEGALYVDGVWAVWD